MPSAVSTRRVHEDDPSQLIRTENRDGVLLATIDMPGRTMNVFSWAMMDALEALIERIADDAAVTSAVVTSGKSVFLAGADLDMVSRFADMPVHATPAEVHATTGRLGRLFVRLEALSKPVVAAVNGLALGGGLELAMACAYRVVADDPKLQLGLPEIKLGLLPGGGGTQRMPRLIGIEKACELLLNGLPVAPHEAKALGLIDEVVACEQLVDRAVAIARALARQGSWRRLPQRLDPGPFDLADSDVVHKIITHLGYSSDVMAKYPAYRAITRAVVEGANLPIAEGDHNEMWRFVDLMYDKNRTAASMLRTLFINRQIADKLTASAASDRNLRFCVQARGEAANALMAALLAAKAVLVDAAAVDEGDVMVVAPNEENAGDRALVLLAGAEDHVPEGRAGILLKSSQQYGNALEIVLTRPDAEVERRALALARRLRATPFVHPGTTSLLAKVAAVGTDALAAGLDEKAILLAQAEAAARAAAAGDVPDTRFADVACVVGGVFPAFTGGPFNFLSRLRELQPTETLAG